MHRSVKVFLQHDGLSFLADAATKNIVAPLHDRVICVRERVDSGEFSDGFLARRL
jgi:hypothetical protein